MELFRTHEFLWAFMLWEWNFSGLNSECMKRKWWEREFVMLENIPYFPDLFIDCFSGFIWIFPKAKRWRFYSFICTWTKGLKLLLVSFAVGRSIDFQTFNLIFLRFPQINSFLFTIFSFFVCSNSQKAFWNTFHQV